MTYLLKDPGASLDYSVDWGADYLSGDALTGSTWSVEPIEEGGLIVEDSAFDLLVASVTVSGGVPGHIYRLTNHVVTAAGIEDRRSIALRVEKR